MGYVLMFFWGFFGGLGEGAVGRYVCIALGTLRPGGGNGHGT